MDDMFEAELSEYFKPDPEYAELDYNDLIKKLEDSSYLEEIKSSPSWRIFRETWYRIYKQAELELDNINPVNTSRIAELQITKRFYKDVLAVTIKKIKADGKAAYDQAKERNLLHRLFPALKKDF